MENRQPKTKFLDNFTDAISLWYKIQRAAQTWEDADPQQWLKDEAYKFSMQYFSMSPSEQKSFLTSLQVTLSTVEFFEKEKDANETWCEVDFGDDISCDLIWEF